MGNKELLPGRELDKLVAEHVNKNKVSKDKVFTEVYDGSDYLVETTLDKRFRKLLPNYSTSIEAAWEITNKLRNSDTAVSLATVWNKPEDRFEWMCKIEFWGTSRFEFSCQNTAPHAICLAALKAVGYEHS